MSTGIKRKREEMEESRANNDSNDTKIVCEYCKIEVPNEVSMRQHLLGQKHKKNYDAEENRRRVERKCGLFVRGFDPKISQDTLLTYFSQFGKIVWVHIDYSFLLLDYDQPAVAENVKNKTHYLEGRRLMVKYRELGKQAIRKQSKEDDADDLIQKLKDIPSFNDQVNALADRLQPISHQQFPKYNKVCRDLHITLRHSFPYCRIHPFGSTITGLEFNNSDIDVFISNVKSGDNEIPFLYTTKRLLLSSRLFSNVIVIPQAKIPILKCIHIETGINCDVNMKNMLGVCNSQLINYYLNLDPKLRNLMIVLKFWAKRHKITGQNHLFTNYSLNLMLIFFLQHSPFEIPSVLKLQKNPQFFNNQDGWNGGFQPINFINSKLNLIPFLELLQMFYSFYSDYEYGVNVICPYLGKSIKKRQFQELELLPNSFRTYKQYVSATEQFLKVDTAVCIQDPFEHSRNTTLAVSIGTLEIFVSLCRLGKKICQENEKVLYRLVTEVPPTLPAQIPSTSEPSRILISMRPGMKYLEEKFKTTAERREAFFDIVSNFTKIVLEQFFKFTLTESEDASKTKHQKVEGQADVYNKSMRVCYKCTGKLNLWSGRKSTKSKESESEKKSIIAKEIAITDQLCGLYKDINLIEDIIRFDICLEHFADPPKVIVNINKEWAYKKSFKSFATFFSANLPVWFKTFEQEQNESV